METPTQIYKGHVAGVMSCDWSESSPAFLRISSLSQKLTTTPYEQVLPEKNSYPARTTERSGCGTEIKADRGIRTIPSECNVCSIRSTRLLRISCCPGRTMGMSGESLPSHLSCFLPSQFLTPTSMNMHVLIVNLGSGRRTPRLNWDRSIREKDSRWSIDASCGKSGATKRESGRSRGTSF